MRNNFSLFILMIPTDIVLNLLITFYSAFISSVALNFSLFYSLPILVFVFCFVIFFQCFIRSFYTLRIRDAILFCKTSDCSAEDRRNLLQKILRHPFNKASMEFSLFIFLGILHSLFFRFVLLLPVHDIAFFFMVYFAISYFYAVFIFFLFEKDASRAAKEIIEQETDSARNEKFFGFSMNFVYAICIVIPSLGFFALTFFMVLFNLKKSYPFYLFAVSTCVNAVLLIAIICIYYMRMVSYSREMRKSLVQIKNKKIDKNHLFRVDMSDENSYAMQLVNNTLLLFDSMIKANGEASKKINESSARLCDVSSETKDNVLFQLTTIEEILSTMGNEKKLSEEMEINFSEAITVSTKTLKSVDAIFDDIKKNRSKLQRIVESNKYSSENLKALSAEIDSIQENVSSISKISERIKIVALNAELVSNSISLEGLNFNKVATEIRTLTDNLMEFSARIYDTVQEITSDGKKLVKDSEICVEKINESNGILSQLENRFSDIKNTAGAATINSAEISADIHSKVSAFKTIIDTLLKISASVNVFNTSTWEVAASIEKLRENSEHILNLNSKYNNQGGSA